MSLKVERRARRAYLRRWVRRCRQDQQHTYRLDGDWTWDELVSGAADKAIVRFVNSLPYRGVLTAYVDSHTDGLVVE